MGVEHIKEINDQAIKNMEKGNPDLLTFERAMLIGRCIRTIVIHKLLPSVGLCPKYHEPYFMGPRSYGGGPVLLMLKIHTTAKEPCST